MENRAARHEVIRLEGIRLREQYGERERLLVAPENNYPAHMLRGYHSISQNADFLTWINDRHHDIDDMAAGNQEVDNPVPVRRSARLSAIRSQTDNRHYEENENRDYEEKVDDDDDEMDEEEEEISLPTIESS